MHYNLLRRRIIRITDVESLIKVEIMMSIPISGLQLPQRKSMNALNNEFIMYRRQELGIYLQKLLRMDYIRHSELIAKFLSPSCDDFNKIAFISMPKQAIGSAGEFAGMKFLLS